MSSLVLRLRLLRGRARLTQAALARLSGVPQATISRIEAGTTRIDLRVLERLADALEVDPAALFERKGHRRRA